MDYTHAELGALLIAVGKSMMAYDLCAAATRDSTMARIGISTELMRLGVSPTPLSPMARSRFRTACERNTVELSVRGLT